MSAQRSAIGQIRAAREYVNDLLCNIPPGDWFRRPPEGVTHVAWQVGHLAFAEYALALKRTRGEKPEDESLISSDFRRRFGKGSVPELDASKNPSVDEIRTVFNRVHEKTMDEVSAMPERTLTQPSEPPHPMFDTKLGSLIWCAQHEFIHAGQIALLRRLFGSDPLR